LGFIREREKKIIQKKKKKKHEQNHDHRDLLCKGMAFKISVAIFGYTSKNMCMMST
jgi:hypothetical protein